MDEGAAIIQQTRTSSGFLMGERTMTPTIFLLAAQFSGKPIVELAEVSSMFGIERFDLLEVQ